MSSLLSEGELVVRAVSVAATDLVYLRHLLEANEGLGFVVGQRGGNVLLVCSVSQAKQLDEFIGDVQEEMHLEVGLTEAHRGIFDVVG